MKQAYVNQRFNRATLEIIDEANEIIGDFQAQGFDLTVRQLYYQMVSKALIENTQKSYKRLASIISNARNAGLIDWDAIKDRTRFLRSNPHWDDPGEILHSAAMSYLEDRWRNQKYRPEVWIEKDALVGVIERECKQWDVPFFSARGYPSQSAMWEAGRKRLREYDYLGQQTVIIHLGDHDPSGIDMTRDIRERLALYSGWADFNVQRIALSMEQIEQYDPPPNPAKITDPRAKAYIMEFGYESWELDALEPQVIIDLISRTITGLVDMQKWEEHGDTIDEHKATLQSVADNYDEVQTFLNTLQ